MYIIYIFVKSIWFVSLKDVRQELLVICQRVQYKVVWSGTNFDNRLQLKSWVNMVIKQVVTDKCGSLNKALRVLLPILANS